MNLRLPMSPLEFLDDVIMSSTGTRTWTSSIGLGYEEFRLPNRSTDRIGNPSSKA